LEAVVVVTEQLLVMLVLLVVLVEVVQAMTMTHNMPVVLVPLDKDMLVVPVGNTQVVAAGVRDLPEVMGHIEVLLVRVE